MSQLWQNGTPAGSMQKQTTEATQSKCSVSPVKGWIHPLPTDRQWYNITCTTGSSSLSRWAWLDNGGGHRCFLLPHLETDLQPLLPGPWLQQSTVNLHMYSGESDGVLGKFSVDVSYRDQQATLPLLVVDGSVPSLLGWDWMAHLRLDWTSIPHIWYGPLWKLLNRYQTLFQDGVGTLKGYEAKLHIDPQAVPKYCKARPVPYAMRAKMEEELQRLVDHGTFEPVQYADWAAQIVPVLEKNGAVPIWGDFKVTVNQVSCLDRYPIPRVEDLVLKLAGGKQFTKLDMREAYQQLRLTWNLLAVCSD